MRTFGETLKILRDEHNWTQKDLAKKVDLSPSTIGMYELDRRLPDPPKLLEFSDIFNVSVDFLLGKTDIRNYDELKDVQVAFSGDVRELTDEDKQIVLDLVRRLKNK